MKTIFSILLLCSLPIYSQVGIGTTDPTADLDINGTLRIRSIQEETNPKIATDSVLVMSRDGTVNRIASKKIYESNIKTAVHGSFSGTGNISLTLGSNVAVIPFIIDSATEDFDTNNEFNSDNNTFTAKQNGIYQVYTQINSSGTLAIAPNYGVRILKNEVVIAEQNFANIGIKVLLVNINVTPPIRNVQTLVRLTEGDTIKFQLYTTLANVSLSNSKTDSFFTIQQVR